MRGFALFEVLVALAIMAILAGAAIPAWQGFVARHQDKVLQDTLSRAIDFAAAEARIRGAEVLLRVQPSELTVSGVDEQILRRERIDLHGGKLRMRSYPVYRSYVRFTSDLQQLADDASFIYCKVAASRPAWVMTLSQAGMVRVYVPDQNGVIRDSRARVFAC